MRTKTTVPVYTIILLTCLTNPHAQTPAPEPAAPRSSTIHIVADDLGYGDLNCYGQQKFVTLRLDSPAAEDKQFMQHYAGSREVQPEGQYPPPDAAVLVGALLQQAGYAIGVPNAQGFDRFYGYNCQRNAHRCYSGHLWSNQDVAQPTPYAALATYSSADDPQEAHNVAAQHPGVGQKVQPLMQPAHRRNPAWPFFTPKN